MSDQLRRYRNRPRPPVVAVRLALETDGFAYRKWGGEQRCKRGDWLVDNAGDVYTVDGEVFARTYEPVGPGQFRKIGAVWARRATDGGEVRTKEGATHYQAGDYVVCNDPAGADCYAMTAQRFEAQYEPDA